MKEIGRIKGLRMKLLALILGMAVFFTAIPVPVSHAQTAGSPTIKVSDNTVYAGNGTTVSVSVEDVDSLFGLEVSLYYDADVFDVHYGYDNWFVTGSAASTTNMNYDIDGEVHYSLVNTDGLSGSGTLFSVSFSSKSDAQPGRYPITVSVGEAYDSTFQTITFEKDSGSIEIFENQSSNLPKANFYPGLDASTVHQSDHFTYKIYASDTGDLTGGNFIFEYDPELLELVSADIGETLKTETSLQLINTEREGYIKISYADIEQICPEWGDVFVTLEFEVKQDVNAETYLVFSGDSLLDHNLNAMTTDQISTLIRIIEKPEEVETYPFYLTWDETIKDQQFSVTVAVDENSGLAAGDFTIGYDPMVLKCLGASADPSVSANGGTLILNDKMSDGNVKFSFVNAKGVSTEQKLVTINFEILNRYVGPTTLTTTGSGVRNVAFEEITMEYQSLYLDIPPYCLTEVAIDGPVQPVPGAELPQYVSCDIEGIYESEIKINWIRNDTHAEFDSAYTANFYFTLEDGCVFSENFVLSVGGIPVTDYMMSGNMIFVTISFDKTPKARLLSIGQFEDLTGIANGTNIEDMPFPDSIPVVTDDPDITELSVYWDRLDTTYDQSSLYGQTFIVKGTLKCPSHLDTTDLGTAVSMKVVVDETTDHYYYDWVITEEATCETDGERYRICYICGLKETEIIDKLGHAYEEDHRVDKNADCTEAGWESRHCTRDDCTSTIEGREIPKLGHNYGATVTLPTCTEQGYTTHVCARCDDTYIDSYVEATGHAWDEGVYTRKPSCDSTGMIHYNCMLCGETKDETADMLGHSYSDTYTVDREASCTKTGWESRHCTREGCTSTIDGREIPKLGHNYGATVTLPTCTEQGYTTHVCARCDDTYIDSYVEATGHAWDEGVYTRKPSCDSTGMIRYTCLECGETKDETAEMLGHSYAEEYTVDRESCCTEAGWESRHCTRDGCTSTIEGREIPMTDHDWDEGVCILEPSCERDGTLKYTCQDCGETKDEPIPALFHSYAEEYTVDRESSCTEAGWESKHCTRDGCTSTIDGREIPMTDHDWDEGVYTEMPGCETEGTICYTCLDCGETKDEPIPALFHSYAEEYTVDRESSCTEAGWESRHCTRDGCTSTTDGREIPMRGHDWDEGVCIIKPSCERDGTHKYTCQDCGETKDEPIPALFHSYAEEYTVDRESSCTEAGWESRHCTREDCTSTTGGREIPMLAHVWSTEGVIDRVAGTITYSCIYNCGKVLIKDYVSDEVTRISGNTRYETSYAIADALKEELGVEKFSTVVVACGTNFPDALAGSYLAAKKNAPILMVNGSQQVTIDLLYQYLGKNLIEAGKVYILGGEAAVPKSVENTLEAKGYRVHRLSGNDRYETNISILKEAGVDTDQVLVCTGTNFADSLSCSATGLPLLLVNPGTKKLGENQKEFLRSIGTKQYCIVGGENAVDPMYEKELKDFDTDRLVGRCAGNSRYDTSIEVAKRFVSGPQTAVIAYAWNFPDGLCGGPLAHAMGAPLILTGAFMSNQKPTSDEAKSAEAATQYVKANELMGGMALGGPAALSDNTIRIVFQMKKEDQILLRSYH